MEVMSSLSEALSRVQADGKAERLAGIADLKNVLRHGVNSQHTAKLKHKAINAFLEDFARVVLKEKSIYLKTVKTTSSAGSRLESFADAFRLLVDTFLWRLRAQSLRTIIDHIKQALPTPDGSLCIPLRGQYLKSLVTVLGHAPHIEHFNREVWCTAVDVCISGISLLAAEHGSQDSSHEDSNAFQSFPDRSATQSSMSRIGSQARGVRSSGWKSRAEDLLRSMAYLTGTSNCPLLERGKIIMSTVMSHLDATRSSSGALDAFKSINIVFRRLAFDATSFTKASISTMITLVKTFWSMKSGDLRDELLASLLLVRPFLTATTTKAGNLTLDDDLEGLLHVLKDDYMLMTGRDRRHLRSDDVGLTGLGRHTVECSPLQAGTLFLRKSSLDSEHNWVLLSSIAIFTAFLDRSKQSAAGDDPESSDALPRKRLKRSSAVSELFRQAATATKIAFVPFVQSLAFVTNGTVLKEHEFEQAMDFLRSNLSHPDPLISSWSLLGLAGCATQPLSKDSAKSEGWRSVWRTSFRLVPSAPHSRSACHLLTVMLQEKLLNFDTALEFFESLARPGSTDVPAIVADASIAFWLQTIQMIAAHASSSSAIKYAEKALSWLTSKWSPKNFQTFSYAVQTSTNLSVSDLCSLVFLAAGEAPLCGPPPLTKLLYLGQLCFEIHQNRELLDYLLAGEQYPPLVTHIGSISSHTLSVLPLPGNNKQSLSDKICDFLLEELEDVSRSWHEATTTRSLSITQEPFHVVMTLAVVSDVLANSSAKPGTHRIHALRKASARLIQQLCSLLSSTSSNEGLRTVALDVVWRALPDLKSRKASGTSISRKGLSSEAARTFTKSLDVRQRAKDMQALEESDESMADSDHATSQSQGEWRQRPILQHHLSPSVSIDAFSSSVHAFLALCGSMKVDDVTDITADASWVDHFTQLPTSHMASIQPFLVLLEGADHFIEPEHAAKLLDRVADECLGDYSLELAEANIQLCLQLMKMTLALWTDSSTPKMANVAFLVYEWMSEKLANTNSLSPAAQVTASHILFRLMQIQPEYGIQEQLPSARQTIMKLLQHGEVPVRYEIAAQMPTLFGLFVIRAHADILDDVLKSLPHDLEWIEGFAIRLKALADLAILWPTLRRTCVYRIVEAVGSLPEVAPHASICCQRISQSLGLKQPRDLLTMFRSHIIYQWLEHGNELKMFPFNVFGFPNLSSLFKSTHDDISCVIFLESTSRNRDSLAGILGLSVRTLLERSFCQTVACAFAQDLSLSANGKSMSHEAENRLRDVLGPDKFYQRLWELFPHILGHMFARMDSEDSIKKALDRRKGYESAANIFSALQTTDATSDYMPPNLKPCFRAQLLLEQIERLCRRTNQDPASIWTKSSTALIARIIFDEVHRSLGPLQGRRTMRKLRVLLALSGPSCLSSYTVESLLHGIRPYLSDKHCSEDAIALFRYLLESSTAYLKTQATFVTGTCLITNLELRNLIGSESDSTTQESTHRATLSRAEEFRAWLCRWGETYERDVTAQGSPGRQFPSLMQLARLKHDIGNSKSHTAEGRLLLTLLIDARSSKAVLTPAASNTCLRLLVKNGFQAADSYQDDILSSDEQASKLAVAVWGFARNSEFGPEFRCWAARCLGRAYSYCGKVPLQVSSESSLRRQKDVSAVQSDMLSSHAAILRLLLRRLEISEPLTVSIAEAALRHILSTTTQADDGSLVQQCVGLHVTESLLSEFPSLGATRPQQILPESLDLASVFPAMDKCSAEEWARYVVLGLIQATPRVAMLQELVPALHQSPKFCEEVFAFVLHSTLYTARQQRSDLPVVVSKGFRHCFHTVSHMTTPHVRLILDALLYLRTRVVPGETSKFDRNLWLEIDFRQAGIAARECKMFNTALLFAEVCLSLESREGRRASKPSLPNAIPSEFLLTLFREVDEPDLFHGVAQIPSIDSLIDRLAFEGGGANELLLRGARASGAIKAGLPQTRAMHDGLIGSLTSLNMSSLALELSQSSDSEIGGSSATGHTAKAAIKLQQWDIAAPQSSTDDVRCLYTALQSLHSSVDTQSMRDSVYSNIRKIYDRMSESSYAGQTLKSSFANLAALSEIDELISSKSPITSEDLSDKLKKRQIWMTTSPPRDAFPILMAREAYFGILRSSTGLQKALKVSDRDAKLADARINLQSSLIHRQQGVLQESLAHVAYLSECVESCNEAGLSISAAVRQETAHVLWAQGELIPSIRILKDLDATVGLQQQSIPVNKAALLAVLGHHVAEARLERPDDVMRYYLDQAVRALRESGQDAGQDAGRVYHEFATYCHKQLTSPDNVAEFSRSQRFAQKRLQQIHDLEDIIRSRVDDHAKHRAKSERNKAKKWYDLDRQEIERLTRNREQFLRQALNAYLYALGASDEHDTDVLRFLSLWLEHASNEAANESVARIRKVPSIKFAPLMNQLASRLQDDDRVFQQYMNALVERICLEHPHHGMYHIYAGSRTKGGNDAKAISRNAAAVKLATRLGSSKHVGELWHRLARANDLYVGLAVARSESFKSGLRIPLRKFSASKAVERDIPQLSIPPITMSISLRNDVDYSKTPVVEAFKPEMSIAGGLSAPKVVTAIASNGIQCKQLYKAGADDLRQDAIMEQVFDQVSSLLQTQKETRQRSLTIRTYKVVPLDATSGAIEFVQNTQPLNDFLRAAHARYNPKDYKWDACRNKIDEVRSRSIQVRIDTYKHLTEHFKPVLRHFFFERFDDPDDWFARRLAYMRSTAAISILGHALGLGDRHCQNILLDTATGEVVHIDLGVAFEAGRILAVPEVVPFRLTRDIIDGFGVMGVEGVFRRCCEFTLDALRANSDAIMTLLNVLRYDPLYSWSMSPLRARRLQEEQDREEEGIKVPGTARSDGNAAGGEGKAQGRIEDEEGGEADRALGVVERKLAPGLSVMATVNELIQQATDERNLAVLFCGWAAFA